MGKQRATVTTCDYEGCEEHYFGDERPEGWVMVVVTSDLSDKKERLTFCSNEDVGHFFTARSEALTEEAASDDD